MMHGQPLTIGIAGGTGSGKTTIVKKLKKKLKKVNVLIIYQDSYYRDRSYLQPEDRLKVNYDHPDALDLRLLVEHLRLLRAGHSVQIPRYDFSTHTRLKDCITANSADVIIVEGLFVLEDSSLRDLLDIKVFIDINSDIRFIRRLQRDVYERGRTVDSVIDQYLNIVRPMHLKFVEPTKRYANIIITEEINAISILLSEIDKKIYD
jgi:uridine kinase